MPDVEYTIRGKKVTVSFDHAPSMEDINDAEQSLTGSPANAKVGRGASAGAFASHKVAYEPAPKTYIGAAPPTPQPNLLERGLDIGGHIAGLPKGLLYSLALQGQYRMNPVAKSGIDVEEADRLAQQQAAGGDIHNIGDLMRVIGHIGQNAYTLQGQDPKFLARPNAQMQAGAAKAFGLNRLPAGQQAARAAIDFAAEMGTDPVAIALLGAGAGVPGAARAAAPSALRSAAGRAVSAGFGASAAAGAVGGLSKGITEQDPYAATHGVLSGILAGMIGKHLVGEQISNAQNAILGGRYSGDAGDGGIAPPPTFAPRTPRAPVSTPPQPSSPISGEIIDARGNIVPAEGESNAVQESGTGEVLQRQPGAPGGKGGQRGGVQQGQQGAIAPGEGQAPNVGAEEAVSAEEQAKPPQVADTLYHGSPKEGLTQIRPGQGDYGYGVYLHNKEGATYYSQGRKNVAAYVLGDTDVPPKPGSVYQVEHGMKNPLVFETQKAEEDFFQRIFDEQFDNQTGRYKDLSDEDLTERQVVAKYAKKAGFDGIANHEGETVVFTKKPLKVSQPTPEQAQAKPHTDPAAFADWIKAQASDRAMGGNTVRGLYSAYTKEFGKIPKAEFGQAFQGLAASGDWEIITPDATKPKPSDTFRFTDSSNIGRPFSSIRPKAQNETSPDSTGLTLPGAGKAVAEGLYDTLWEKVQKGETKEAGQQSHILQAAKIARKRGALQTREEFKAFAQEVDAAGQAENRHMAITDVIDKYVDKASEAPSRDVRVEGDTAHVTYGDSTVQISLPPEGPTRDTVIASLQKIHKLPNGEPPPDAPIVGGGPTVAGGVDAPVEARRIALPTAASAKSWVGEATRILANSFGRNLSGIERVSRKSGDFRVLRAARKSAGAETAFQVAAARAIPRIRAVFKDAEPQVQTYWNSRAESRLRGVRQRWQEVRDLVIGKPADYFSDSTKRSGYLELLKKIQGRTRDSFTLDEEAQPEGEAYTGREDDPDRFSKDLVETAGNYASNKDYQGFQLFIANVFDDAYRSVGTMHDFVPTNPGGIDFNEYIKRPEVVEANKIYDEEIGKPLTDAYKANKGEESNYLGPLGTYFPLIPHEESGQTHPKGAMPSEFSAVPNRQANFTTGLAGRYETSQEAFLKSARSAMVNNNRGALINTLIDAGMAQVLPRGTKMADVPPTMLINGIEVPATTVPFKGSFTIIQPKGEKFTVSGQNLLLPEFVADELLPILERETPGQKGIGPAMAKLTQAAIFGPHAEVFHAANLLGSMMAGTPFVGKGFDRVPGTVPGLKLFTAIHQVMSIDPNAAQWTGRIQELGELGLLHPKTGTVTTSARIKAITGASRNPLAASLYGMRGADLRVRLALLDIAHAMHEEAGTTPTPEDLFNFVSQAGNYTKGLDSSIERSLKRMGIAPFVTAGKTQISVGGRALTGFTRTPNTGMSIPRKVALRGAQLLSGGVVGYTGMWMALNYLYTGKLPDRNDRIGEINIKPEDRTSEWGQRIWGPGSDQKAVSIRFFNPTLGRGIRDFGVQAYVNGMLAHKPWDQIAENIQKDAINGMLSPALTSPTIRIPTILVTGHDPYLSSLSEGDPYQSKYEKKKRFVDFSLMKAIGENETGSQRILAQMREALLKSNPFIDFAGQVTGIGHRRPDREKMSAGRIAVQTLFDLAAPRLEAPRYPKKRRR